MPVSQYNRPPITEAVVEFRFESPPDENKRSKAIKKLRKLYDNYEPVTQKHFEVKVPGKGSSKTRIKESESVMDKLLSRDMTQQLLVFDKSFLVSQLAPYSGWAKLSSRVKRDWSEWRKAAGFSKVERVGMRYINRIDIPIGDPVTYYEHYVNVYPAVPKELDPCVRHSVNVQVRLKDIEADLNVKSAMVESPIPDHVAVVLDLDVSKIFVEAPSDKELMEYMGKARDKKNEIFEACITDKARELFSR